MKAILTLLRNIKSKLLDLPKLSEIENPFFSHFIVAKSFPCFSIFEEKTNVFVNFFLDKICRMHFLSRKWRNSWL